MSEMKYFSTRGGRDRLSFEDTVLTGLAPDGGLFIPDHIPSLPSDWSTRWPSLPFTHLALEIYSLFISPSEIPRSDLLALIEKSYSTFRHPEVAPLRKTKEREWVLELWHGPTFAFKDVALQFLGNLFEYFLQRRNSRLPSSSSPRERLTVLGATSGDTGSAAIYGLRGKKDLSIFILHPKGKVSPIQEAQMTTVLDPNVFNLAVKGTFDDCQDVVKACFGDKEFNAKYRLGAINSINWARILAQIVYYFSSYFALQKQIGGGKVPVQYVVPTGNFGDILAGYYAKKLGLPMGTKDAPGLVIATNANDILTRFWKTGTYSKADSSPSEPSAPQAAVVNGSSDGAQTGVSSGGVKETLSPAMDILVSSNFERLLFYLALQTVAKDSVTEAQRTVLTWMSTLKSAGTFSVPSSTLQAAQADFAADRVSDGETREVIRRYYERGGKGEGKGEGKGYVVDPHTAVGLAVAERQAKHNPADIVQIVLSTAHPAKFSQAVESSLSSLPSFSFTRDVLPPEFEGLLEREKRVYDVQGKEVGLTMEVVEREVERLFGEPKQDGVGKKVEATASV